MKSILTLLFVVTLGAIALANTGNDNVKVNAIKMGLVLDTGLYCAGHSEKVEIATDQKVARLYRRENTLVKKALRFSTKRNKSKLA